MPEEQSLMTFSNSATEPPADNAREQPGGNNPPSRTDDLLLSAETWIARVPEINNPDTANVLGDLVEQISKEWTAIEAKRDAEQVPIRAMAKAIQDKYKPLLLKLETAKAALKVLTDAWFKKEDARIEAEKVAARAAADKAARDAAEAARRLAESQRPSIQAQLDAQAAAGRAKAAQAASAAAAKAKPQIQGEFRERAMSFRTHYSAEVIDRRRALAHYAGRDEMLELLVRLASADAVAAGTAAKGDVAKAEALFTVPGCELKVDRRSA